MRTIWFDRCKRWLSNADRRSSNASQSILPCITHNLKLRCLFLPLRRFVTKVPDSQNWYHRHNGEFDNEKYINKKPDRKLFLTVMAILSLLRKISELLIMGQIQYCHRIFYLMSFHITYGEILYMIQHLFGKESGGVEKIIENKFKLFVFVLYCNILLIQY